MKAKLIKKFKPINEFKLVTAPKRRCWQKCGFCGKNWNDIPTNYVHLVIQKTGEFFCCDKCLENESRSESQSE